MRVLLSLAFVLFTLFLHAQKNISGQVLDHENSGLPGVTVYSKSTPSNGAGTDREGKFSLKIADGDTLIVRLTGYALQEIPVSGKTEFIIHLEEESNRLNELVITAFGIQRQQRELGYSTQSIGGEDLVKSNTANIVSALSGKLAGVNVIQSNGVEGGTTRFVIRGNNLITGNNQPLIIVDGVPIDNTPGMTGIEAGRDWGSGINNINPDDIEDLNVLKGAPAAALYGARGGNGVILITLKKGRERAGIGVDYSFSGRMTDAFYWRDVQNEFGFGGPFSFNPPTLELDSAGVPMHPQFLYTDFGPEGKPSGETFGAYASSQSWGAPLDGRLIRWWDGEMRPWSPQPDNFERFFQTGFNTRHNLAFSGGGKFGTVRVSFTRENNKSVALNSHYNQTTANLGTQLRVSNKIRAEASFSYIAFNRQNSPVLGNDGNSFGKIMVYGYPRSYQGENLEYENPDGTKRDFGSSPFLWGNIDVFWSVYNQNAWLRRSKIIGSAAVFYEFTNWLTGMVRTSTNLTFDENETRNKPTNLLGTLGGSYGHALSQEKIVNNDFLFTAKKQNLFPGVFAGLSIGGTQFSQSAYNIGGSGTGEWVNSFLYAFSNSKNTQFNGLYEGKFERRLNSLYSFLDLNYNEWLFGQVAVRNDYSSALSAENGSYWFPSGSLSFLADRAFNWKPDWLSYLKTRVAFSETADDGGQPYQLGRYYSTGNFAGQSTAGTDGTVRPLDLIPQRNRAYEAGLEISFFKDRLQADVTLYQINSFRQIVNSPAPVSSGFGTVRINTGEMRNRGVELVLRAYPVSTKNFTWKTTFNFARNQNRLISLSDGAEIIELESLFGNNGPSVAVKAGQPYGIITGFDYVRDEATGKPFLNDAGTHYQLTPVKVPIRIYDENGRFLRYANSTPKATGGLQNSFSYKSFTLSVLTDFKWKGDIYSGTYATSIQSGQSPSTLPERLGQGLPYVSPDGETRNIGVILPGLLPDGKENNHVVHYYYKYLNQGGWGKVLTTPAVLENTWIKLREVSFTWSMPRKLLGKSIQKLDINLIGRDLLWLYSSLPDNINPEGANGSGNAQGVDFGALPGFRSFGLGLNVGF